MNSTMKTRLILGLLIVCCISVKAQDESSSVSQIDNTIMEYYYCYAFSGSDTSFYTENIELKPDTLSRFDDIQVKWKVFFLSKPGKVEYSTGVSGPFSSKEDAISQRQSYMTKYNNPVVIIPFRYEVEK